MSDVVEVWNQIEEWLRTHAPASHGTLLQGATDAQMEDFRESLNLPGLGSIGTLWRICNGVDSVGDFNEINPALFLLGDALLGLEDAASIYQMMSSSDFWDSTFIPFTAFEPEDPYSGRFLDVATGKVGGWSRIGEVEVFETDFTEYFVQILNSLTSGESVSGWRPVVVDGSLSWE